MNTITRYSEEGNEPSPGFTRYIVDGDKVERIYRALMSVKAAHGKKRTWYRIAKDAEVSYGWTHDVLRGLENEGIIEGLDIIDPKGLFMKWLTRRDRRLFREYNVQEPEGVIAGSGLDHAYTGYFAENQLNHYLFPRYQEIYIKPSDAPQWHALMTTRGYVGKGNVHLILADDHVFFERQEVNGHHIVSTQQLIVDLYRTGAECSEAADLLLSKVYR